MRVFRPRSRRDGGDPGGYGCASHPRGERGGVLERAPRPHACLRPRWPHGHGACGGHVVRSRGAGAGGASNAEPFPRNVLFVFQPAEETTGGAKRVCKSGVFERYRVTRIFGMHLWPDLPAGSLASRPGPLLARSSETTITFHGVSSHIAKWRDGRDALGPRRDSWWDRNGFRENWSRTSRSCCALAI